VPQNFTDFYKSKVPNYFGMVANNEIDPEKLKSTIGKYIGIDFNTGKTVDLGLEEYKKAVAANAAQPFDFFVQPPAITGAAQLTPTNLAANQYEETMKALQDSLFKTEAKQNVLNLGAATAFGAASLPFTEFMRNQDYNRQLAAFQAREQSPTAQAARNLSMQQQAQMSASSWADKLRAFADVKRATVEPLRSRRV